uniref:DUF3499 domain-containing protein n=1 Tax=Mycolicibacterium gilvum (strain PYR-GCK) TaxID=350054 RepID=A4TF79_MYCGI|nr:conserved hypothetical protein [Mycolicibacterium gilvum PYR-GCK]
MLAPGHGHDRNGWASAAPWLRVSGVMQAIVHANLLLVNVPRRCCRPGCPHYAVATLTFVYADSTAVVGPLATVSEPHSWDLCVMHAGRITAPRGWELVRHAGPLPTHPDDDDLVALADAVREGREVPGAGVTAGFSAGLNTGFTDPVSGAHGGALMAPPARRPETNGRRRGHLRVLPDPAE